MNFKKEKEALTGDFANGIYTAPVILSEIKELNFEKIENSKGLEKTRDLIDTYFNDAALCIKSMEASKYKDALINLIKILKEEI